MNPSLFHKKVKSAIHTQNFNEYRSLEYGNRKTPVLCLNTRVSHHFQRRSIPNIDVDYDTNGLVLPKQNSRNTCKHKAANAQSAILRTRHNVVNQRLFGHQPDKSTRDFRCRRRIDRRPNASDYLPFMNREQSNLTTPYLLQKLGRDILLPEVHNAIAVSVTDRNQFAGDLRKRSCELVCGSNDEYLGEVNPKDFLYLLHKLASNAHFKNSVEAKPASG